MRDDSGVVVQKIAWLAVVVSLVGCLPALRGDRVPPDEWPNYGNDAGGTRYSPLAQIDRGNVGRLRLAWTYRTRETGGASPWGFTAFEPTPLMVERTPLLRPPSNPRIARAPEAGS